MESQLLAVVLCRPLDLFVVISVMIADKSKEATLLLTILGRLPNFKKKERQRACAFKMFCLGSTQDDKVPCTAAAKELLLEAGLGSKSVTVPDVSCSRTEFWDCIISAYPKLAGCGGFELLRCMANSRDLEVLSQNISQSAKLLKTVVGNGRVFIRTLQKDLDLKPVLPESSLAVKVCITL